MQNVETRIHAVYNMVFTAAAVIFVLIDLAYLLGVLPPDLWRFQTAVLFFLLLIAYLPYMKDAFLQRNFFRLLGNGVLLLCGLSSCIYLLMEIPRMEFYYGSVWTAADIVFGTLMIIVLLDVSRKNYGWSIPVIAVAFIVYTLFGHYLPSYLFQHTGFSFERTVSYLFGPGSIFGTTYSVFVNIIFVYLLFGTLLEKTGAGKFLVDLSFAAAGRMRGGPAKVAVVASAVMGTISGNSVSNVATIGPVTIPLMKRIGYKPVFAGAVESAASTGGQILPPVMGAGAFIMAEFLQMSYQQVIIAALLPALLYFIGIFFMVDLEAVKENLKGMSDVPKVRDVLKSGYYLLIPILILIAALLIAKMPVARAALWAIAACIVVSWFTKDNKLGIRQLIEAMVDAAKNAIGIGAVCAAAGIIVGTVAMTGFGNQFGSVVIDLAGDNVLIVAFFSAVIALILGLGLPTTAAYIITMSVAVPAMVGVGVPPLAAHMFVFYFAVLSAITPPVGSSYFVAAAIAESPLHTTGWLSCRLAFSAFTVPFFFVLSPLLLMEGEPWRIALAFGTALAGVAAVSMAQQRVTFWGTKIALWQSLLLVVSFVFLLYPELHIVFYGIALLILTFVLDAKLLKRFFRKGVGDEQKLLTEEAE